MRERLLITDSMPKEISRPAGAADELIRALRPSLAADRLRPGIPLAPYTTFRIGGPADVLYDATSADDLATAVTAAQSAGIPWFVLGLGANILIGDLGFRGLVIRNCAREFDVPREGAIHAGSGVIIADLIPEAVRLGLSGLEHYVGIPSTVGGAVWQNLHFLSPAPERARTMFIAEVVESVDLLTGAGVRQTVSAAEMRFGYDTSRLHDSGEIALAVTFALTHGDETAMRRTMQENLDWRGARHPHLDVEPSAGSIFKKIEGVGAGRLIDDCGLKGFRIGGAQISPLHANIIVNVGNATASDVRAVIAHAQAAVLARSGHHLEPEIGFIGEF
ncbi:MAG: UDP-N-acetylmuramate dehydrogenase [Gemmatimonadetes bacterium]|nr:UDP-N-acetylmuramate dehydrogenase [Gemmatimonadota bacterium]